MRKEIKALLLVKLMSVPQRLEKMEKGINRIIFKIILAKMIKEIQFLKNIKHTKIRKGLIELQKKECSMIREEK